MMALNKLMVVIMIKQKIKVSSPQEGKAPLKMKKIGPPNKIINYILKGK